MKALVVKRLVLVVFATVVGAGWLMARDATQDPSQVPAAPASAVAQTGLLPVFGVAVDIDPSQVDGTAFPSTLPNLGVGEKLQGLWDGYLRACGFNVLRFTIDVRDPGGEQSARMANLCLWAKQSGVRLVPVLVGSNAGEPLLIDYAAQSSKFVGAVATRLKGDHLDAYAQILAFQLERPLNHPAMHGTLDPASVAEIKSAAASIRAAETEAFAGAQVASTPLVLPASFDAELVKGGNLVGSQLTDAAFQSAYARLAEYLTGFADAPEVGLVSVEWFPGSVTPEAVERLPAFLRALSADLQGKMLILSTGYSSAFVPEGDQARYYALALGNLADYRAGEGTDCPFIGVLWHTAVDTGSASLQPPTDTTVADMAGWDWSSKAGEVLDMWTDPSKGSPEMKFWMQKLEGGYGVVGVTPEGGYAPKQAYEALTEAQTTIAQAAETTGATQAAEQLAQAQTDPGYGQQQGAQGVQGGGVAGAANNILGDLKNTLQTALNDIVGAYVQKVKDKIMGTAQGISGTGGGGYGGYGGYSDPYASGGAGGGAAGGASGGAAGGGGAGADLRVEGTVSPPVGATVGLATTINVSMFNSGATDAYNATAYFVDSLGYSLGQSSATTVSPGSVGYTTISWEPYAAGNVAGAKILLICDNELNPADNEQAIGAITVAAGGGGGGAGGGGGVGGEGAGGAGGGGVGGIESLGGALSPGSLNPSLFSKFLKKVSPGFPDIGTLQVGSGVLLGLLKDPPLELSPGDQVPVRQAAQLRFVAKRALPMNLAVTNKFFKPIENLSAACFVNGKQVAAKQIGTVLPGQRRTIMFSEWTPATKGGFNVEVRLQCLGTTRKVLHATLSGTVDIADEAAVQGLVRPGLRSNDRPTTRMVGPLAPAASSILVRPTIRIAPPMGMMLRVGSDDIRLMPFPVGVGLPVQVSVNVGNPGTLAAPNAKVEVFVDGQGLGEVTVDLPSGRPTSVGGFKAWTAVAGMHTARAVVSAGGTRVESSRPFEVRAALARPGMIRTPVRIVLPTGLRNTSPASVAIGAMDIHISPSSPAPGTEAELTATVRNGGGALAKGVRVEAFVDSTRLGTATLDLAPGTSGLARGFGKWTAGAGTHTVRFVASLGTQKQEATRTLIVTSARLVRPPVTIPTRTLPVPPPTTNAPLVVGSSDIEASPSAPKAGDGVKFAVTVRNPGRDAVAGVKVEFFVDSARVGEQSMRSLAAGRSQKVEGFPLWKATSGRHTLRAVARVGLASTTATRLLEVGGAIVVRPPIGVRPPVVLLPNVDLGVQVSVQGRSPKVGDKLAFTVTVANTGNSDAKGARLSLTVRTEKGMALRLPVPEPFDVAAGKTSVKRFTVTIPAAASLTISVGVQATGDRNMQNNQAQAMVQIAR